jgi:hypothetical protein
MPVRLPGGGAGRRPASPAAVAWRRLCAGVLGPCPGGEDGQVLVPVVLMMVALLGMAGLALDVGMAYAQQQAVQQAADAAAMAGADDLPGSAAAAIDDATAYAAQNRFRNGVGGVTVQVFSPPEQSRSQNGNPNSVEVLISEPVSTTFLRALGFDAFTVHGHAVATSDAVSPCAICLLGRSGQTLTANGNVSVDASGGALTVDSGSADAAVLNGNGTLSAASVGIVGGYAVNGNAAFEPTPQTGVAPAPDPLAHVAAPQVSGPSYGDVTVNGSNPASLSPGIYGRITANGSGSLTLQPGVYVITGGLTLNGDVTLSGSGVTLYFTCGGYSASDPAPCGGSAGAGLTENGNATVDLGPPASGAYAGLTLFYDRGDTQQLVLNGNPGTFTGTVYAASSELVLNGNASGAFALNSLIVSQSMVLNGNGRIDVHYDPTQNYEALGFSHLTQ